MTAKELDFGVPDINSMSLTLICMSQTLIVRNIISSKKFSYSTVTDFAKFRGLSTSVPRASAE